MDLAAHMQQLYTQFGHLPGITIELHKELLAININNQQAEATVLLQGAQLSHYQRHGQQPLIWCSDSCDYQEGQPLRGGIPICWPWFGDLSRNSELIQQQITANEAPVHGFVRNKQWQLTRISTDDPGQTEIILALDIEQGGNKFWPFACRLQLTLKVGAELQLDLSISNTGSESFAFSNALHSYFAISDIANVTVQGFEGLDYIDCLQDWSLHQQHGTETITQEVDRIYQNTVNPITLVDNGWQRQITLTSEGSHNAVLWNPWIDKAKRLSNFNDDAYQEMLCIEPANTLENTVTLEAGQCHTIQLAMSTRDLN